MPAFPEPPFAAGRPLTRAAFELAARVHGGQRRAVDDAPFVLHPLEVGALLSGRGCDDDVVAAGLLHDVIEAAGVDLDEVRTLFGERVADIVAAVTEDAEILDYELRKRALRDQVARSGRDAQLVFAADKVAKARELRAQAARGADGGEPELHLRLDHYERSLSMLRGVAPALPLVRQLAFELWALRALPPSSLETSAACAFLPVNNP